jgi:hypothetical protein
MLQDSPQTPSSGLGPQVQVAPLQLENCLSRFALQIGKHLIGLIYPDFDTKIVVRVDPKMSQGICCCRALGLQLKTSLTTALRVGQTCTEKPTRLITNSILANEIKIPEPFEDPRNIILVVEVAGVDAEQTMGV